MRDILKFLALGMTTLAFICLSTPLIFAQNNCDTILKQLTEGRGDRGRTPFEREQNMIRAIDLAKKFIAEPACQTQDNAEIIAYFKKQIPLLEKRVADNILYDRFNRGVKDKNWDEIFASGKEIIAKYPDTSLDPAIVFASTGFNQVMAEDAPVNKYNDATIYFAKWVIEHIENKSERYGAFGDYEYKTAAFPDGKSNTLGWMNYIIGYITYERLKNPKEALPFLYKATQFNSAPPKLSDHL